MDALGGGINAAAQAAITPTFMWGKGEFISMAFGVLFAIIGWIANKKTFTKEKVMGYVSNGIAFGPLAMIVMDPANKLTLAANIDLFDVAVKEARVTLWWAAFVASLYMIATVMPQK